MGEGRDVVADIQGTTPTTTAGGGAQPSGTEQLKHQARETGQELKQHAKEAGSELKQQAKEITHQAGQAAGELMNQARSQVKSQITTGKDKAAGTIGTVAEALHTTGDQLRQKDQQMIGEYADRVAGVVDEFSGYLRERNVEDLTREAEDFARQRPGMFLTGAVALGFLAARFLKSSRPDSGMNRSQGYGMGSSQHYAGTQGTSLRQSGLHPGDGPVQTASGRLYDGDPEPRSPRGEPITSPGMTDEMDEGAEDYQYAGTSRGSNR